MASSPSSALERDVVPDSVWTQGSGKVQEGGKATEDTADSSLPSRGSHSSFLPHFAN